MFHSEIVDADQIWSKCCWQWQEGHLPKPPNKQRRNELYTRARRRYGTVENHKREINSYHYPLNSSQYAERIFNKISKSANKGQEWRSHSTNNEEMNSIPELEEDMEP